MQTVAGDADPGSRTRLAAWSLWAVACLVTVGAAVFVLATPGLDSPAWGVRLATGLWAVAFATVGAVLATRIRGNPIGWLLLVAGVLASGLAVVGELSAATAAIGPGSADLAFWATTWAWIPVVGTFSAAVVLFPDGQPENRFWTGVLVVHAALTVLATVAVMWVPTLDGVVRLDHGPFGEPPAWLDAVALPLLTGWQTLLVLVMASVVIRLRGADTIRRWQLRWVAFAAAIVGISALTTEVAYSLGLTGPTAYRLGSYGLSVSIALIPIAIGVAVLRYRLYEIDRIIGRTVVYAAVTALLAGLYLAVVLTLQAAFTFRSGRLPDVAVAGTTLLVAAAFSPVRRRVQDVVDRRFNRRHVDAARLVDRFGADLRREVEHDAVEDLLRRVANESVQPASVGIWVRPVG